MKKIIFYQALVGLSLSLVVHFLSLQEHVISDEYPIIWGLHLFVFVVWFPSIILLVQNPEIKKFKAERNKNPFKMWAIVFKNTPKLIIILVIGIFIYSILGFFIFTVNSQGGAPSIVNGQYVLSNHGDIIKELTKSEYKNLLANELRGFSSIWLAFFSMTMAMMWPKENIL